VSRREEKPGGCQPSRVFNGKEQRIGGGCKVQFDGNGFED
jgi:hypothetical protein